MSDELARKEQLNRTLRQLRDQLGDVDAIGPETRAALHKTVDEIQEALDADQPPRPETEQHESLLERLGDAARQFEESHPALAGTVGSVIDALGRMGI